MFAAILLTIPTVFNEIGAVSKGQSVVRVDLADIDLRDAGVHVEEGNDIVDFPDIGDG